MKVILSIEYEIDVEGLDPKFVDIKGFAMDEAKRMLAAEDKIDISLFEARVEE